VNGERVKGFSLDDILRRMRGRRNTKITVIIGGSGTAHPITVSMRRKIVHPQVVDYRREADRIGYMRISEFVEPVDGAVKHAVRSLKQTGGRLTAFILDLRENPGGLIESMQTDRRGPMSWTPF
jgi:carboxyl-terminal processing protease